MEMKVVYGGAVRSRDAKGMIRRGALEFGVYTLQNHETA